jgi:hypothetical protein
MKDVWESNGINTKYITSPDHYGAQYVAWRQANPDAPDTSIQAWVDSQSYDNGKNSLLEAEDGQALPDTIDLSQPPPSDDFNALFGVTPSTKDQTRLARPTQELPLRAEPSGSAQQITVLPTKLAIKIIEVQGPWAHVIAPGGFEGWVDAAGLQLAS